MSMSVGPKNLYSLPQRSIDPFSGVYPAVALCFMLVLTSTWVSTQYVASALGYQAKLGAPLFYRLYTPFDLVAWEARYDRPVYGARVQAIFVRGRLVAFVGLALSLVAAGTFIAVRSTRSRRQNDLYGSAHWATEEEILGTGLLDQDDGVYVGAWEDPSSGRIKNLRPHGPEHVMV